MVSIIRTFSEPNPLDPKLHNSSGMGLGLVVAVNHFFTLFSFQHHELMDTSNLSGI